MTPSPGKLTTSPTLRKVALNHCRSHFPLLHVSPQRESLTPLHEACLVGHKRITHLLLALGADITAKTQDGYTPLLCAAGNGHVEVAKVLIGAGCDGNELISPIGINALHIAAWTGQAHVVKTLLEMGVEVETPSKMQKTAIEFAIEQGHTEVMEEIRNHRKKLDKGIHDKSFFQKKIMQVGDKIRGYYEETLKQEVEYFEEQMEEQSLKEENTIALLKGEIERLKRGEGPSKAPFRRKAATITEPPTSNITNGKKYSNFKRKIVFPGLAKFVPLDKVSESDRETDPDSDLEEGTDTPSSGTSSVETTVSSPTVTDTSPVTRRVSRPRTVRQKSMVDLVSEMEQKEHSMTNLRKPEGSEDSVNLHSSLKSPHRDTSAKDASSTSPRRVTFSSSVMPEPPPYKPLQKVEESSDMLSPLSSDPPDDVGKVSPSSSVRQLQRQKRKMERQ
ncbi:putative inversin-A [Apostichopus japonicus]|uniref:Putative inversin-A n=1 Tax=Stichopus japonicus TaxID=307972 RepID=A0A2G8KPJ0_STIJA|nr:putative inversin-A [Apostichopus japonicus]